MFYLVAYVFYLLLCPAFVKKHKNIENYISKNLPNRNIIHEWSNFIRKNGGEIIKNKKLFKKLRDSSFNSQVYISIEKKVEFFNNYSLNCARENKSGFMVGVGGIFVVYGSLDDRYVVMRYNRSVNKEYENQDEDYKEIALSLFDLNEKTKISFKILCYISILISSLLFIFVLSQNIIGTVSYIIYAKQ